MPCFDVEKDQNKDVAEPSFGKDLLRKEIALPHRFSVSLKKLVPSSWSAIRTDVVTVAFENGLDRVASDGLNSQFAKFSEDPAISPAIVLCQFQDQLLDLICGSRPATLFFAG